MNSRSRRESSRRNMMRPSGIALVLLVSLVSCAKSSTPGGSLTSGIQGTVTVGPHCPVVQAESPCPDTPFGGKVRVSDAGGGVVAEVQVDPTGAYRIGLEPGTYVVEPVLDSSGGPPTATPATVLVQADAFTTADLSVDTGIR